MQRYSSDIKYRSQELRKSGYSVPEISAELKVPKTTIFRYVKDVEVSSNHLQMWLGKRGGSAKRKLQREEMALERAKDLVKEISDKEKLIFLAALYWAEGNKKDFILMNSDPELIRVYVTGLRDILGVRENDIKVSLRVYEDINLKDSLLYWSKLLNIPMENFGRAEILAGKKKGKLLYGMCRVRLLKGADYLKLLKAVYKVVSENYVPVAQMDRAPRS